MKKRTLFSVLATVLIIVLASSTIVLAAGTFSKVVDTSVTVLTPTPNLEVYADAEATTPITNIAFGSLYPGDTSAVQTVYVKNTGQLDFSNVNVAVDVGTTIGTVTYSSNNFTLARDTIQQVDLQLSVYGTAPPGAFTSFSTTFEATY